MTKLKETKQSPRLENGVIYWYEGDTFQLVLTLRLLDADGAPVTLGATDRLELTFRNRQEDTIATCTWRAEEITNNQLPLQVDEAMTALFPCGRYRYDLRLLGEERTTLVRNGQVVVE